MKNETKPTWKDVVKGALAEIGASGRLDDIYSKIKGHPKTETNPTWRDTVRRTLQQYSIFYQEEKGSGIWYLREEKPLEEIATVSDFPKFLSYPKVVKVASYIDVIWFSGDTDALVPEFAFEVEHTTDVTKGLGRLLDLHRSGQRTRLFVVLPFDKMSKFDKEIGRSLFRDIKEICRARTYEPLIKLYALAKEHNLQKTEFFGE